MGGTAVTEEGTLEHRGHRVWWGSSGASDPGGGAPLLTLHGGPGLAHDYLEPLAGLGDRPVVFYDQYGCGRSDRAPDPAEYDLDLVVDEVDAVRSALALDRVHLFGHSYGGALLLEYLLRRKPAGVLSVTLSNTFASARDLDEGWDRRLAELPPGSADVLRAGPTQDPAGYDDALRRFTSRFVLPGVAPEALVRSQRAFGSEAYERLHGPSWFQPEGRWSTWDASAGLGTVEVPALVIGGVRDQCPPELAERLAAGLGHAELAILDAAHLPFFEVPEQFLALLRGFLARVEAADQEGTSTVASRRGRGPT